MSDSRVLQIRTEKFRLHYEAMQGIGAKTLEPESQTKVSLLIASYEKIYDATTKTLKDNEAKNGKRIGSRVVLTPNGEARRDRIGQVLLNIKLPPKDCLIKKSDLPTKDQDGADKDIINRNAVALLVSQLGPFYDHEATGEKRDLLAMTLDDESLKALDDAGSEEIAEPAPVAVPLADAPEPSA